MRIDVLTLFPEMFAGVMSASIMGKAREKGIVTVQTVNFRDYSQSKHNTVDDTPYGGGGGMVLKPEPIFAAVESLLREARTPSVEQAERGILSDQAWRDKQGLLAEQSVQSEQGIQGEQAAADKAFGETAETGLSVLPDDLAAEKTSAVKPPRVILMCPQGKPFTQQVAEQLAAESHLIFICGHYEGYDERIREHLVTDELSIGDYVLTGGELPAMVVIDSVVRLLPGVLGNEQSAATDSFSDGLLEYPHYTRPARFRDWEVPAVLVSGHHEQIAAWRRQQALERTLRRRPELLKLAELSDEERRWLKGRKTPNPED